MAKKSDTGLLRPDQTGYYYSGPMKFKGKCSNCGEPKNRHCGRCKACPGYHRAECILGPATGAWH